MEKVNKENSLPLIFNFSNLWNILPFYGTLPKWMWLLCSLNSATSKIWNDNREMFFKWGKDYKSWKSIYIKDYLSADCDYINHRYMYFDYFGISISNLRSIMNQKIFESKSNIVCILDKGKTKSTLTHMVMVDENNISEYLPASKWTNFTSEEMKFEENNDSWKKCEEYILKWLKTKAVVVKKGI